MDFETLLSERLAALLSCGPDAADTQRSETLWALCELLDADRATLWLLARGPTGPTLRLADQGSRPDKAPFAPALGLEEALPWCGAQALAGRELLIEELDALPPEAMADRETLAALGCRSCFAVPFFDRGAVFGVLTFEVLRRHRPWTTVLLGRCRLVAQVFCAVLLRERTEAEAQQEHQQLLQSQKVDALGRLAGGIAHDFNNLLTVIQSVGNDLVLQLGPDSPYTADLHELLDASHRAVALTRQLLSFGRQQPHRPQVFDLVALVKDAEKLLRRVLREDIKLSLGLAVSELPVFADPSQLHQVVVNLAVNARDAMPGGGDLFVEVSERERACGDGPARRHATLTVRDTGTGIPPELRKRVFEPFFTTKEAGKGTGLGLATVQRIVTQSGGEVELDSEVGVGTAVHVFLPRVQERGHVASAEHAAALERGSERVLIIEDDPMVRRVLTRTLSRCGYEVLSAPDGAAGLSLLAAEPRRVDLVLTDVVMPRMSGLDVARAIRARWPAMPVLFTSGFSDVDVAALEALSGSPLVTKPTLPHELSVAVRAALNRAAR